MSEKKKLDAASILTADDLTIERVHVPEWGGDVFVRAMGGAARDAWEAEQYQLGAGDDEDEGKAVGFLRNLRARLLVRCICDEDGELVFSEGQAEELGRKSAAAISRLFEVARRLNGITKEDEAELAGNSEAGPSAGSGSD